MSSTYFRLTEHTIPCQHIREYPFATAHSEEEVLSLAIKQYTPLDNPTPQPGDVTIIGAHACGFPKELYEPLWDDIHRRAAREGFRIRAIWIADVANHGASGVLNEELLGNDPSWIDHSRDLLHLINHFRVEMPLPLVGMGHSFGAAQLVNLAYMHPRLLQTLILMDPVILPHSGAGPPGGANLATASAARRDLWPSRAVAAAAFAKSAFYRAWDPRVLERWLAFGLRETPTKLYPDDATPALDGTRPVTLATTKHQEVFTYLRRNHAPRAGLVDRERNPDLDVAFPSHWPFYRPEQVAIFKALPTLRPSVLYVYGERSDVSTTAFVEARLAATGTGAGGSGGARDGRVAQVILPGIGHLVAMEAVEQCAAAAAPWIAKELVRWKQQAARFEAWTRRSDAEKMRLSDEHLRLLGGRPAKAKAKL